MTDGNEAAALEDDEGRLTSRNLAQTTEPFQLFSEWLAEAETSEPNDPNAMALATVDESGLPDVRMVLLKGFDADGLRLLHKSREPEGRGSSPGTRRPRFSSIGSRSAARCACAARSSR